MSATSDDEPRATDDETSGDGSAAVPDGTPPAANAPGPGVTDADADGTDGVGRTDPDADDVGTSSVEDTIDESPSDADGDVGPEAAGTDTGGTEATAAGTDVPDTDDAASDAAPTVGGTPSTATSDIDSPAPDVVGSPAADRVRARSVSADETTSDEGAATRTATLTASAGQDAPDPTDAPDPADAAAPTATPPAPVRTGSWADDLWARFTTTLVLRRRTEWILLGAVTLLAALLRLVGLSHPGFLVFDETFYVKDAWSLVHLGYEAKWPENANDSWAAGDPDVYFADPSYVVHPPLGKLVIGLGMLLFGADNAFGWRAGVAIIGTLAVPLMWLVTRKLFRSPVLATIGAFLLAIDGHAIVTSRVSILDGILMFFVLLGFFFVLLDRQDFVRRLDARILDWRRREGPPEGRDADGEPIAVEPTPLGAGTSAPAKRPGGPDWGPAIWARPWLVSAAVAFGLAASVKWSGLYFLAAFCLYTVAVDAWERRRRGVTFWASAAVLKQGPVSFLLTIPAAFVVYLTTWTGWLATTGGFYRTWADEPGNAWTGALAWVPRSLQSLWHYSSEAYKFHTGLAADHPYQSSPLEWPFLIRPTAFSYEYSSAADNPACHAELCVEAITSISNPIIWWAGTVAVLFCLMMLVLQPRPQLWPILVGVGAGYLPWLAYLERQAVFQFYAIAFLPFMILAIVYLFHTFVPPADAPRRARTIGVNVTAGFLVLCTLVSALFLPVWTGILIPDWYWSLTHWLPGWK